MMAARKLRSVLQLLSRGSLAAPNLLQAEGAAFIIVYNIIATFIILKVIGFIVPLRMDEATLKVGDDAVHGETAYAIGTEGE
jgi:Amt family ammonium transporter